MNPRSRHIMLSMSAFLLALALGGRPLPAQSQTASHLVGTWTLVRVENVFPDARRESPYGPDPRGRLIFDADGRYVLQILSARRPRFASNDKSRGTAEEYRAAVDGTNSHFGTYEVNPGDHTVTFRIEHASFPNWEGTTQVRSLAFAGDRLTYVVPVPTSGTAPRAEVEWRRVSAARTALAGTWILAAAGDRLPDGTRVETFGREPRGLLIVDDEGRYSLQIVGDERPAATSVGKSNGSRRARSVARVLSAHLGRLVIDSANRTLTFEIERASFPREHGAEQARNFTLSGDELIYRGPASPPYKGAVTVTAWRRVR